MERDEIEVIESKQKSIIDLTQQVWPICPKSWLAKLRGMGTELPNVKHDRERKKIGRTLSLRFRIHRLPFNAYALRHAYAIQGILYGLQDSVCAKWMRHILQIHHQTYHKGIDERHFSEAYQSMRDANDR